jgi:hypothetical protein
LLKNGPSDHPQVAHRKQHVQPRNVLGQAPEAHFGKSELLLDDTEWILGLNPSRVRMPVAAGLLIGSCFDVVAKVSGRKFPISAVRVRKFCANSVYGSAAFNAGFTPPVPMEKALERTVRLEFLAPASDGPLFFSE